MHKNASIFSSFKNAGRGLLHLLKRERNFQIEFTIGSLALILCALFQVTRTELLTVLICCMVVLTAEGFNTAIESVVDLASPDYHVLAKHAKDFAAGAVLFSAICSAIIGLIIFIPYFF